MQVWVCSGLSGTLAAVGVGCRDLLGEGAVGGGGGQTLSQD